MCSTYNLYIYLHYLIDKNIKWFHSVIDSVYGLLPQPMHDIESRTRWLPVAGFFILKGKIFFSYFINTIFLISIKEPVIIFYIFQSVIYLLFGNVSAWFSSSLGLPYVNRISRFTFAIKLRPRFNNQDFGNNISFEISFRI